MITIDDTLGTYLDGLSGRGGALGELLRRPDDDRGARHTPREIAQQPHLWRHTARLMQAHAPALRAFLAEAGLYGDAAHRPQIVFAGAGTSDYVGLSLSDLLRMHFGTASCNWPTTRITASPGAFFARDSRYLMLHFARSGNSPESTAVLQYALRFHGETVRHVVITCNEDGELARTARKHPEQVYLVVLHEASNDRALAMTSSFSNMVVAGQSLVHLDDMDPFVDLVDRIAACGEFVIETYADTIRDLAAEAPDRVFYLGNNDLLGAAVESALKVQELTIGQVMATGEDTLAFRHGPISAVDRGALIAFFLSADPYTRRYQTDLLDQYRSAFDDLGVRTVVVADRAEPVAGLDDEVVTIAYDPNNVWRIPAHYQVNVAVLFGQLFGLFSSYHRGLNVDDPSVDKALYSRTVQGVRLYDYSDFEAEGC